MPAGEDEEGWQMGSRVAFCHTCRNTRENNRPNISESRRVSPENEDVAENNPSTPPTSSLQGFRQFEIDCASRGFHVYREIWNPRIGDKLEIEQDYGNVEDSFAIAIKAKPRSRIRFWETVGHIPREIVGSVTTFLIMVAAWKVASVILVIVSLPSLVVDWKFRYDAL